MKFFIVLQIYLTLFSTRFLLLFRDLMAWINSMMALVSSDELAKDVTGAEALLERHQVWKYFSKMYSVPS